jgi:DNA repair exonuclease SbcCD ATPase subunit
VTGLARRRLPEERELEDKEAELASLEMELADAETKLAELRGELQRFRSLFQAKLARLFAELDEVRADLARRRAALVSSDEAWSQVQDAERQARESRQAADEAAGQAPPVEPASEEVKSAFRVAARKVHPDLVTDVAERKRRTEVMARLNAAYARRDHAAIAKILEEEELRPERIEGDGVGERLIRVIRKIDQVRRRLADIADEDRLLRADDMWQLYERYVRDGAGVLEEIEARLRSDLKVAREQLKDFEPAHDR